MFEFMYAKKVKKDIIMEIIDKYIDDYFMVISHKPNGNTEIFIGSKKKERTETHACDCISRQAAIEAVGYYSLHSGDKLLFADKPLKALPSVDPERRPGKWINVDGSTNSD